MLFSMIALWTIALVLLIINRESENARWGAAIAISGGFGGFSRVLLEQIRPYLIENNLFNDSIINFIDILRSISSFISHNGPPYTYLIFSICYSGFLDEKKKRLIKYLLFIPVIVYFFAVPVFPRIEHNYKVLGIWAIPYIILGTIFLLYSTFTEKNRIIRKNRSFVTFVAVIPMTFDLVDGYIAKLFNYHELFRFNTVAVIIMFMLFIAFTVKDGFLGIKLKIEKQYLDNTIKAMTSGTTILNHSIKNEIAKISVLANNTKENRLSQDKITENMEYVLKSSDYIITMINKIQKQIRPIELDLNEYDLADITNSVLDTLSIYIREKKIVVKTEYCPNTMVYCDKIHIKETINNIVSNSIEALETGGSLLISIDRTNKELLLTIKDTGKGISKDNLLHVIEPFFTTKRHHSGSLSYNYGLGLSYCYNIMQQHGGNLEIESKEKVGTIVYLRFKLKTKTLLKLKEQYHGKNKSITC